MFITKTTAANVQFLLADMQARQTATRPGRSAGSRAVHRARRLSFVLQVHKLVLKFLKLPLKAKDSGAATKANGPKPLLEAEDPNRLEVFDACLEVRASFGG